MSATMEHRDGIAAFAETARQAVASCAAKPVRDRASQLAGDGLLGILAPESAGGLDLGLDFAVPVMEAAGAGLLGFPLAETLLLGAAFGATPFGPAIVLGERVATIAWAGRVRTASGRVSGTVGRAPLADQADLLLVATETGAVLVARDAPGVTLQPAIGLDLEAPEHEVVLDAVAPLATLDAARFATLREDALLLRAAEIGGSAQRCLALALEHVSTREQFGRTLVSFQALRHALARQKLAVEHIGAALERHAALAASGAGEARHAARTAYAAATRFGIAAIESALQLHGGMGFTWEVDVHRHLRRARTAEAQGDAAGLHRRLAQDLLTANA
ncbi:MAG: acyl-CoA/acyl-ACP dehydrogenase [Rhodospirillales bacterium]|nr:acyl-CoA/acyl-ACP dehydrogenase [Rhodospirillales bacterium]MBN8896804.1 acyl-CoA/acyl-ACP dehydrogenase [Rhodospirillales bacterium]MBN8899604.1 acyl-CoA/acyl-ACP dehydrogenase [Rhodospirillales bacterium]